MPRYLVVANQTLASDELLEAMRERAAAGPSEFWVVVPATPVKDLASRSVPLPPMPVMGGVLTLPGTPAEARRVAQEKLEAALARFAAAGFTAGGEVGDRDPIAAVQTAVSGHAFDEIIVSTLPDRLSRWLHADLPRRIGQRFDLPVTHVVAAGH